MESIFGVPWEQVELDHVRAFLETAGDEGILWEAKATDPRRADAKIEASVIREPICGLANSIGGYVIVGCRVSKLGFLAEPGVLTPSKAPGGDRCVWPLCSLVRLL
jgi:hypothetical protein